MNDKLVKILVLEGGGVFGSGIARFLSFVGGRDGKKDLDGVDAIAGTSVGSILALSYCAGHSFKDVEKFFRANLKDCFKKRPIAKVLPMVTPMYDSDSLYSVLRKSMGYKTIGDIRDIYPNLDVFVNATNVTKDTYKVFDNIEGQDDDMLLADVAAYSSAAPSYFKGRDYNGDCLVDGGMISNCMVIDAAAGLHHKRGIPFSRMDILALGTGREKDNDPSTVKRYNNYTLLELCKKIIVPYVTLANQTFTTFTAENMGFHSFTYYNPIVRGTEMDNTNEVPEIIRQCEEHRYEFLDVWYRWLSQKK